MSHTSLHSSTSATMSSKFKNIGQRSQPDVRIHVKGSEDFSSILTYSTSDKIEGIVSICCAHDTHINQLEISFLGSTRTFVDRVAATPSGAGRTQAFHQFLKMTQPIPASSIPESQILRAGTTYNIDFLFVVPERTLDRICRHSVANESVHEAHVQLPPSLGERSMPNKEPTYPDDFAPDMASIRYAIAVVLTEATDSEDLVPQKRFLKVRRIRVVPATDEQPPLNIEGPDSDYFLRAEKDIRKGIFKGKLGRLVMEAAQPKSIRLPAPGSACETTPSTMATIMLRFDPADAKSPPPRLGSLSSKFKIATFYASTARQSFPNRKGIEWDTHQGLQSESISLSSRCMAGVEWKHHTHQEDADLKRQNSSLSSFSTGSSKHAVPTASSKYNEEGFYTAELLVPITLPTNKSWVPTFHSCLVSRVYSISLHLGIHGPGMGPSISLKVPIQISSEGSSAVNSDLRQPSLTAEELAIEEQDANAFFVPRSIQPIADELVGGSNIAGTAGHDNDMLPPAYETFRDVAFGVRVAG